MEPSPLLFLVIGLGVGAIAAFFIWATVVVNRRVSSRVRELLEKGASPAEALQQLVAAGNDPAHVTERIQKVLERIALEQSGAILESGHSAQDAQRKLSASGVDPKMAAEAAETAAWSAWCVRHWVFAGFGTVVFTFGGFIVALFGRVLSAGNESGRMPTFPYAGMLTTLLGVLLAAFGVALGGGLVYAWRLGWLSRGESSKAIVGGDDWSRE